MLKDQSGGFGMPAPLSGPYQDRNFQFRPSTTHARNFITNPGKKGQNDTTLFGKPQYLSSLPIGYNNNKSNQVQSNNNNLPNNTNDDKNDKQQKNKTEKRKPFSISSVPTPVVASYKTPYDRSMYTKPEPIQIPDERKFKPQPVFIKNQTEYTWKKNEYRTVEEIRIKHDFKVYQKVRKGGKFQTLGVEGGNFNNARNQLSGAKDYNFGDKQNPKDFFSVNDKKINNKIKIKRNTYKKDMGQNKISKNVHPKSIYTMDDSEVFKRFPEFMVSKDE